MPIPITDELSLPDEAVEFRFTRSSGPGGQNVNKVNSRVELSVRLDDLPIAPDAKERLRLSAGRRVSAAGVLTLGCQSSRDQAANRRTCLERLRQLVLESLIAPEKRVATRPSRGARERRLETKKRRSTSKAGRRARVHLED